MHIYIVLVYDKNNSNMDYHTDYNQKENFVLISINLKKKLAST